jgi:16S rRNA (guanine527-N7)-methyltransferase
MATNVGTEASTLSLETALSILKTRTKMLEFILDDEQEAALARYCELLSDYNAHTNLVSNAEPEVVMVEHVLDSMTLIPFIDDLKEEKWGEEESIDLIDIGSGAGLPGLILAITIPYLNVTMIDSVGKKINFIKSVIDALDLGERVEALCDRAEELGHDRAFREKYHACTSRAVGTFDMVAELGMPFLMVGGQLMAQKSATQLEEAEKQASITLPKLSGKLLKTEQLDTAITGKERIVLIAEKQKKTPATYPRKWAQIKNEGLSS